ncbi:uncharacterized protein LOC114532406 isoform X2 [Dendronephthya gigantea]|uniref:uncharacterized protein LOC114532406 isoform X2 n=1 Tax=Dendronephthya gigantea TaxID=151771 RepID=UPI00106D8076|nr:uncharacterized protein LOC114532406 isoform X2 [Dendronephthya gigantea]
MYGLWSSSLVLMMAILFSVCTPANTEEGTKQKCQGSVMKLKCLNKSYALSIVAVFYGREYPGSNMCRSPNSKLSDELRCERNENNVTGDVKRLCEGKNNCNFTIESPTFSLPDKCPKVYKYMHIDYKCVKIKKSKREKVVAILVTPTPSLVKTTSRITTSYKIKTSTFTSTEVIKPSTTMVAIVDRLLTTHQSQDTSSRSSSLSSSRPHSRPLRNVLQALWFGFYLVYLLACS